VNGPEFAIIGRGAASPGKMRPGAGFILLNAYYHRQFAKKALEI
jgi:hypothetical protein